MKDFYKALDLDKTASQEDIKKQYKKLAMQHHPDRGGDIDKFKEVGEAYEILSDNDKRQQYDCGGFNENNMMRGNINPDEIFRQFFGNMNIHAQMQQHMNNIHAQQFQNMNNMNNMNNNQQFHQVHQVFMGNNPGSHQVHHVFMGNNNVRTETMVIIQNGQRIEITRQM